MWWRQSWFSLKGKAGIPGQTEGRPATSIGPRVLPVGSLQQRGLGALANQQVPRAEHNGGGLRLLTFHGHEAHGGTLSGLADRLSIGHVVLLSLDERLDVSR